MTQAQLTEALTQAQAITNPTRRAYAIERITNAMYADELPTLREQTYERKHKRTQREVSAQASEQARNATNVDVDGAEQAQVSVSEADIASEAEWVRETPTGTMVAAGGNAAWLQAIEVARINATPEGLARTERIASERNASATKVRTAKRRAKAKPATEARKAKAKRTQKANGPKSRRKRAVAVPPSQRA